MNYEMRAKQKRDYGVMCLNKSKELEMQEAQMLNRLQKTYQTERSMTEQLNKLNDQSPHKLFKVKKYNTGLEVITPKTQTTAETNKEKS